MDGRLSTKHLAASVLGLVMGIMLLAPAVTRAAEIDRIREKSEELASRVRGALYDAIGMGDKPSMDRAHRDYAYLLGENKIRQVDKLAREATDPAERALRERTADFLRDRTIWADVAPTFDNYLGYVQEAAIQVGDRTVTLRRIWTDLAQTSDQTQRRLKYLAARELVANANVFLLNVELDLHQRSQQLDLGNYYDFLAQAYGWDREAMSNLATRILNETGEAYSGLLQTMCQQTLGQELARTRAFDLPWLLAQHAFDDDFPADKLEKVGEKTLDELGIDLGDQRYLRVDLKDRGGKDPEAHTFGIANGRNTRVTMIPDGGLDDYRSFLRALGQAEFYYNISEGRSWENRYLGSSVMPQVFGELMILLFEEPRWLTRRFDVEEDELAQLQEALRFLRLYELREAAGRYLFQLKVQADPKVPGQEYTALMEKALLIPQTGNEETFYLLSNDRFRSGGTLIAACVAAQLRQKLREDYGPDWFQNRKTGEFLLSIAAHGYSKQASEWVAEWGGSCTDPTLLLQDLTAASTY